MRLGQPPAADGLCSTSGRFATGASPLKATVSSGRQIRRARRHTGRTQVNGRHSFVSALMAATLARAVASASACAARRHWQVHKQESLVFPLVFCICLQAVLQATEQATQGAGKLAGQNGLLHPQYCESVYKSLRRPTRTIEVSNTGTRT